MVAKKRDKQQKRSGERAHQVRNLIKYDKVIGVIFYIKNTNGQDTEYD